MKIFPARIVREIDKYTIENEPVASIDLMERAALRLTDWYVRYFKSNRKVFLFAGPGNNGGDALAMARLLDQRNYKLECFLVADEEKLSNDCRKNLKMLRDQMRVSIRTISSSSDFPEIVSSDVVIDGLFGSGLTRPLQGVYRELIKYINTREASVISVDIPSGLFGEDNSENPMDSVIKASYTLTFQFPFLSFLFSENERYTGTWKLLDIGLHQDVIKKTPSTYSIAQRRDVANLLPARPKFSHKGTYGHALCICGSWGMMGAAILTAKAALRGGAGLVSVHTAESGYQILQTALPEAIVSIDKNSNVISEIPDLKKYSAITMGPGIGVDNLTIKALRVLLSEVGVPLVLDADAINMLATEKELLSLLPQMTILTPHPGEFDRLAGKSENAWSRHIKQIELSKKLGVIIILKGAHTGISFPDGTYVFNSTGNPGMATGGSGDVLSGIIVSLLAQGVAPPAAAISAVYLHGRAGDLAMENESQEALIAGDIINYMGAAFKETKELPFLHEGRTGGVVQ